MNSSINYVRQLAILRRSNFDQRCLSQLMNGHAGKSNNQTSTAHILRPTIAEVNRLSSSKPELFHQTIVGKLREEGKRARKKVRRSGLIPTNFVGRGKLPDLLIQVDPKPFIEDYKSKYYAYEKNQKWIFCGPLYELRVEKGGIDEFGNMLDTSKLSFERIRVLCQNIVIHPVQNVPIGFQLTYAPEDETIRVRIPIHSINEKKSPGVIGGGYLNEFIRHIDVKVEPFVKPPLYATADVGQLHLRERMTFKDVHFEGKNEGCLPLQSDDTIYAKITKI